MKRSHLIPAFFLGSPLALIAAGALFQLGVMSAGAALLVTPVFTTVAAMQILRRL